MSRNFIFAVCLLLCANALSQNQVKIKGGAHEGGVNCIAISDDGNLLLSGGADTKSFLWNIKSGDKLKGALKHPDKVTGVAINPAGKFYVTGCADYKARVLDIESALPVRIMSEHSAEVSCVSFNPVTQFIATGGKDKVVKIWDNSKNKASVLTLTGHEKEITKVEYTPDGRQLISLSLDNTLKVWDAATGELVRTVTLGSGDCTALAVSHDGAMIAVACGELIQVYKGSTYDKLGEIKGYKAAIHCLAFTPDTRFIAAGGAGKKILICDASALKVEHEIPLTETEVTGIGFSGRHQLLIAGCKDGSIRYFDAAFLKLAGRRYPATSGACELAIENFSLREDNNNGILDGGEKASFQLSLRNSAQRNAYGVIARIQINSPLNGISFEKETYLGNIAAGSTQNVSVPLSLATEIQSGNGTFTVELMESGQALPGSKSLSFQSGGATNYSYIMIVGQGFSSATGKAETGAPITAKLRIKNIARSEAKNIRVNFLLPENVKAVNKLSELVPVLKAGEEKEIQMDFFAEPAFRLPEIKMGVDIEGAAFTNAKDIILKVKMNEKLPLGEDYSTQVAAESSQVLSENSQGEQPLYRGGANPMKGLNVNKPKEMIIGNYYALIIGIDKYKGSWTPLVNAVNDATAIEKALKASYKFDQFRTLYNEQATREAIINQLEWLVSVAKETDNVFIYYSGHGEYKKELIKGYWVPVDANTLSTSKYISNSDIQTYINGIKSKHTLLVSDACFSGDIFRGNAVSVPFEESEKYYREVHSLPSRQALTSGGIEPVMDGGKDGHSVFAYYFLKSLEANKEKYIDISQVYTKVKIPVINNSEQTPKLSPIKNSGDEGGQFIFIKK